MATAGKSYHSQVLPTKSYLLNIFYQVILVLNLRPVLNLNN